MKELVFLLILIIGCADCTSLKSGFKNGKTTFIQHQKYAIRNKPLTNREYLICLSWYLDVYGNSYPRKVKDILPKAVVKNHKPLRENIEESYGQFRNYTLHPKYLDYPMLGLDKGQVAEILKWMSDRHNEHVLIDKGYLEFNPNQKDEDCFVTESYLADQYQGIVRAMNDIRWKDGQFLPSFRLPYNAELDSNSVLVCQLKAYPFSKDDFLWRWNEYYLDVKDTRLKLNTILNINISGFGVFEQPDTLRSYRLNHFQQKLLQETFLPKVDAVKESDGAIDYGFEIKDQFGHMNFTIIGSNVNQEPVAIEGNLRIGEDIFGVPDGKNITWIVYSKAL